MPLISTREEIVRNILAINPASAYALRGSADAVDLCASPIYTNYRNAKGEVVPLALVNGRYAAGYVRVSTLGQKEDGWSLPDQAERVVDYCLRRGLAFRVYSDATLSGKLPTDDKQLIRKMLASSARRYEEAYKAVFFSHDHYTEFRPQMETWLEEKLGQIRSGGSPDSYYALDLEGLDSETHVGRSRKNHGYRPALSELMRAVNAGRVHTLALTDISRLARSQSLSAQLTDDLQAHRVTVVGLVESLDWIAGQSNLGEQITAAILTIVAEHKLREVCLNAIRGTAQSLRSGKANGSLPHWLQRDAEGNVSLDTEKADTMRRIIAFTLSRPDLGINSLATHLNDDPNAYPPPHDGTNRHRVGRWRPDSLKAMLCLPALTGHQDFFGRRWDSLPPLIDEETYRLLQARFPKSPRNDGYVPTASHLMSGLMRCSCGSFLLHMNGAFKDQVRHNYYRCFAASYGKRAAPNAHIQLRTVEVERFFTDLVRYDARLLLEVHRSGAERDLLEAEVGRLRQEIAVNQQRAEMALTDARARATSDLAALGRPALPDLIAALAATDPEVTKATEHLRQLEVERDQCEHLMRSLLPSEHLGEMEERVQRWEALTAGQKNELLRRLIHQVRFVREGEEEFLEIVPNTPSKRPLPRVPLILIRRANGATRLLPTLEAWVASW